MLLESIFPKKNTHNFNFNIDEKKTKEIEQIYSVNIHKNQR